MNVRGRELLALHAGHDVDPGPDGRTARCRTCAHTLLLDNGRTVLTDQDRAAHVGGLADSGPCPAHIGELARACRCCRADRLAVVDPHRPQPQLLPTADVASWAAACRAALPQRRRKP